MINTFIISAVMRRIDWSSRFGVLVHDVARVYSRSFDRQARDHFDLTRAQCRVLVMLERYGVMSQKALAERMELTPMALVRLVDRLEEKNLLRRVPDPCDKRAFQLHLNQQGEDMIDAIVAFSNVIEAEALQQISATEKAELVRLLRKVLNNLTASETAAAQRTDGSAH
ncbi:MarR family winged helix-turn-helix transcriptional regulator [Pandoraea thiooxydans]|nr:MarR family transcriptional regulator [Pandoraea thiooxydans]